MDHRKRILSTYDRIAPKLGEQYDSVKTPDVLPGFVERLPQMRALDLGCGNGRDAEWLANQGFSVDACDGSEGMLKEARASHAHPRVNYYYDRLPEMLHTAARNEKYDVVLLSAVWMHLSPEQRAKTLENILRHTKPGALIFLSLRHGPAPEDRPMFEVSADELKQLAGYHMLDFEHLPANHDKLGRSDVWWDNGVLRVMAKDGEPLSELKRQAVQGSLSSTYKPGFILALTQTLGELGDKLEHPDAAHAAIPTSDVIANWQSIYERAIAMELPQVPRAPLEAPLPHLRSDNPGKTVTHLWKRNGPMRHLVDTTSGQPLFTEVQGKDGTSHIQMPRAYAETMQSHGVLVRSGMAESMRRYLLRRHTARENDIEQFVATAGR